jgi:hypothetical protein
MFPAKVGIDGEALDKSGKRFFFCLDSVGLKLKASDY